MSNHKSMLKLRPAVKDYIWGGTRLSREFDIYAETDRQAEAWMLSCHKDGDCIIENTELRGRTLRDYLEKEGKSCLGTNCDKFDNFPILIKLIDAKDNLSVQVHPDDRFALENEGEYGKTEAWYIVDCDEGAELIYGFREDITPEEFRRSIEENTLLDYVNRVKVKKGDLFFIPAGTLHAICKGILLAEVQQNSNTTYRVYDYGRLQNGKPRELHVEKAIAVTNCKAVPADGRPMGEEIPHEGWRETLLTSCDIFTARRLDVEEQATVTADETSFVSLVALDGNGVILHGDTCLTLYKGESVFIPAGFGEVTILGSVTVLETRVGR
ncbi:MAG: class I mannose-6-phosphate isomerase [Oscillospiraceae bacterium]|nr:class I mannose-6-phosphate isomerase [Oscillospiraceae bacterium]